jgi:hypothetical protein
MQATFFTTEFSSYCFLRKLWVRIKLFKFDKLWEIFEKSSEHYKKIPYFWSNFFYSICFKSTKKRFKMATLTFRLGDHIFFICYLKNHLTFFWDFRLKLFGNISKIFLISRSKFFKLIFLESLAENIWNGYFHYFKNVFVLFLRSCWYSELYFFKRNYGSAEILQSPHYPELKEFYHTQTCRIDKSTHTPF